MTYINKKQYDDWKQSVIDKFYTSEPMKTQLLPKNGVSSSLKKNKVVLVLDLCMNDDMVPNSKLVATGDRRIHKRTNEMVSLFHIGKQKQDFVDVNYDEPHGVFLHPVFDFGGLTNYRQKFGTKPTFLRSRRVVLHPKNTWSERLYVFADVK